MQNTQAINVTAGNATATGSVTVSDNMPGVPCPGPAGYKYVGARYVPVFAEPPEWSINSTYEPLTIVMNEGNSYTSKQYVPVVVNIDNTEYWALTGAYNSQVEQYRKEVADYKEDVETVKSEVANNTTAISTNKTNLARVMNDIVIIGDSWSEPESLRGRATWTKYFAEYTKANIHNYARGGAVVSGNTSNPGLNGTFLGQVNAAIADTSFDHSQVGTVILFGGVNDFRGGIDYNTLIQYFKSHCATLHEEFANARIIVVLNHGVQVDQTQFTYFQTTRFSLAQTAECHCTFGWLQFPAMYDTDWLHPSSGASNGYKAIAQNMLAIVYGGNVQYAVNCAVFNAHSPSGNVFAFKLMAYVDNSTGCVRPYCSVECTTNVDVTNYTIYQFEISRDGTISSTQGDWLIGSAQLYNIFDIPQFTVPELLPDGYSAQQKHTMYLSTGLGTLDENKLAQSLKFAFYYDGLSNTNKGQPLAPVTGTGKLLAPFGN